MFKLMGQICSDLFNFEGVNGVYLLANYGPKI